MVNYLKTKNKEKALTSDNVIEDFDASFSIQEVSASSEEIPLASSLKDNKGSENLQKIIKNLKNVSSDQ